MAKAQTLKRMTTVDALVATILESILDGSYLPGEWFREEELAVSYGVSRHTLRAALAHLVQQGILQRQPHRGVFVPRLSVEDTRDVYRARATFELDAARTLSERGDAGPALRGALVRFEELSPSSPWSQVVEADVAFHKALVDTVGSPRLSTLYNNLLSEFRICILHSPMPKDYPDPVIMQHQSLVQAIDAGDPEQAVALFRNHLENSERLLLARIRQLVAPSARTG